MLWVHPPPPKKKRRIFFFDNQDGIRNYNAGPSKLLGSISQYNICFQNGYIPIVWWSLHEKRQVNLSLNIKGSSD